jgi:hypothetical protein
LVAGRVVGKRDGQTQELAQALLKSVSQIENYSYAYFGYKLSRKYIRARDRAALSPGHFATLYTCWRRIEFDPRQCDVYLSVAVNEKMNSEELREFIENDNNLQPKPVTLGDKFFQKAWDWTETIADLQIRLRAQELLREFQQIARHDGR